MLKLTKANLTDLNHVLGHLLNAGIPLSIKESIQSARITNTADSISSARKFLDQVNDELVASGAITGSIESFISRQFPEALNYQQALEIYAGSGNMSLALEQLRIPTRTRLQATGLLGKALVYPTILAVFVVIGFAIVCGFTTPTIINLYDQAREKPPVSVQFLEAGHDYLPVWLTFFVIAIIGSWIWWIRKGRAYSWRWVPGNQAYYKATEKAHTARIISELLNSGCNPASARFLASQHVGEIPTASKGRVANDTENGRTTNPAPSPTMPPLIEWAIESSEQGGQALQEVLPMISDTYANSARRESQSWQTILPTIAGVTIGGLLIFGYGFSLFMPVIEILHDLGNPLNGLGSP